MMVSSLSRDRAMHGLLAAAWIWVTPACMAADLPAGAVAKLDGKVAIAVAFSPDGRFLATGGTATIDLWNVASGKRERELTGHDHFVCSLAFSADGKLLASGSADHSVRLWEAATGNEIAQLKGHTHEVRSVSFSPDGKWLASGSGDHSARLWDIATRKQVLEIAEGMWVYSVAFSADGKLLAVGSMNKTIRLWDTGTGKQVHELHGHTSHVYSVTFSPDGRLLASGSEDGTVRFWEVATGKSLRALDQHGTAVYSLAFSRDGRTLASVTMAGQIGLWETVSLQPIRMLSGAKPLLRPSVAFAPDGKTLATPGGLFTAVFWDRTSRRHPGRPALAPLSSLDLEGLRSDLGSTDATRADEALWTLVDSPEKAVAALAERLEPKKVDAKEIAQLIADLDSDQFAAREKASEQLTRLGTLVDRELRATLAGKPSLEVRRRVEQLLEKLEGTIASPEVWHQVRAVAVLEHIGNREAQELLRKLAQGAEGARLTQEAKAAIGRVARARE